MAVDSRVLPSLPLPGLSPDKLGNYLASLGLLRLLARKWPTARLAWRGETPQIVGGPDTADQLVDEICKVAACREWTPYQRGWKTAQKESSTLASKGETRTQSGMPFSLWQASAEEPMLELFAAHVVPTTRGRSFNPALGHAGKIGQRDFAKGFDRAVELLAPPPPAKRSTKRAWKGSVDPKDSEEGKAQAEASRKRDALRGLLRGEPLDWLVENLNAATWFSEANKLYGSGQRAYRDGLASPWGMALACEGIAFLAGSASRRLGARSRGAGAFPFVTQAVAPRSGGEAGRDVGEFWAPIWERPMTVPEVAVLFRRGRAEAGGRGALTPGAFATAVLRRGVDAGLTEFRRFALGWTTAADYIEARFQGVYCLHDTSDISISRLPLPAARARGLSLGRLLWLVENLPADRKVGQRWRFLGLRGPVETAMLQLASSPDNPEAVRAVLDAVVGSLDKVDRNRGFREAGVSWEPLPIEWLPSLFLDAPPSTEARLALALVSGFPRSRSFTLYRFGVEWKYHRFEHPERAPARWTWGTGPLPRVLSALLQRRTLDWETARSEQIGDEEPARFTMPARGLDVSQWLDGVVDECLLARWISRLALFDWRYVPREVRSLAQPGRGALVASAALCLFGLLQPLFDLRPVERRGSRGQDDLLDPKSGARTPATARALAGALRTGHVDTAVRLASSRYAMAGTSLTRTKVSWHTDDPERLFASLLFPISDRERTHLVERWLRPQRKQGDEIYVK